ncbi:uncharacterized protein BO95DRAFT_432220 [Aspergillus brunneoviolaceus CBS 621.78]|uniref:Uncharacterized protein n=1 Tax=Aspergillus brunneoviolaceus CBS 621.78 TaxID=1450534 RepID=A0ACD1G7M8_9EURO|nr:hypothetical protein BO95DRAFT_432220 [Aspergillus brunneoviolaceus CBS 621.78]RAH45248.1 hypothetical protein BO95DRAFT_432220 [Aspergillus brunneoviolaceus CBS 621.78]
MRKVDIVVTTPLNLPKMLRGSSTLNSSSLYFTPRGREAWNNSAFERLINKDYNVCSLNLQYRSQKAMYDATSKIFYDGKVESHGLPRGLGGHLTASRITRTGGMTSLRDGRRVRFSTHETTRPLGD